MFCALPHGESQKLVPALRDRVGCIVDLAADFRLKDAALYPQWYGEEHGAPELLAEAVFGLPELFRSELAGATLVAAAGCYPTSAGLALAPLLRQGLIEAQGIVVDAASGVSGAGRGLKDTLHFGAVDEDFTAYGLLTHRHTPEMEQILGAQVLFTPHLVPMVRGILATCYARPERRPRFALDRRRHGRVARGLRRRALRRGDRRAALDEGDDRLERRARDGARGPTHRLGGLPLRARQPGERGLGAGRAMRQRRPGTARDHRSAHSGALSVPVSVTAPKGFVATGGSGGIKANDALDVAVVATADGRAVPAAGVFTSNLAAAAPVQISRAHLGSSAGRAAGVILTSGNANAATGGPGRDACTRLCRAVASGIGAAVEEILVCQTGLIGIPFPISVVEPQLEAIVSRRDASRRGRGLGGTVDHDDRHGAQGGRRPG